MSISLPYCRKSDLPAPLPSHHEIETTVKTLPTIRNPDNDGRIVIIRDMFVVKYGVYVNENEGHTLLFLEQCPSIPACPTALCNVPRRPLYIVMQYMPGTELESLWPSLSENDKSSIIGQLRSIFQEIRSLQSSGFYGSVARGPVPYRYFFSRDQNRSITGPFEKEEEFSFALSLRSRHNWEDNGRHGWISDFFTRNLPSALSGHQSIFTHSDLHPQNILIKEVSLSNEKEYRVAAIVDWKTAGWYPAYWEYAAAFALFRWVDDWPEKFERIVDPWPLEAAMVRLVHQDLEFQACTICHAKGLGSLLGCCKQRNGPRWSNQSMYG